MFFFVAVLNNAPFFIYAMQPHSCLPAFSSSHLDLHMYGVQRKETVRPISMRVHDRSLLDHGVSARLRPPPSHEAVVLGRIGLLEYRYDVHAAFAHEAIAVLDGHLISYRTVVGHALAVYPKGGICPLVFHLALLPVEDVDGPDGHPYRKRGIRFTSQLSQGCFLSGI